ncbi:MAG: hypothetical protein JW795_06215 [Chitinivibrionales bacterium]|nr:hypothetical protein [Chitinivibrionales bacterium]
MITTEIPIWSAEGVLPPINSINPVSSNRSPYTVKLTDLVSRYALSPQRIEIMEGFLEHRKLLHSVGIFAGFQWLDGSFLENVKVIENREPADIDVVTFFHLPAGKTQVELFSDVPHVFDKKAIKHRYRVDNYFVCLSSAMSEELIERSTYWYSLWSHRRNFQWKGYLRIDLSNRLDEAARIFLKNIQAE